MGADYQFQNQDLDLVHPDFIASSSVMQNTLLIELKSGANASADQLRRSSRVTDKDLIERAQIPPDSANTHDVVLIGEIDKVDRLQIELDAGAYAFPLLAVDDEGISLTHNHFTVGELERGFSPQLRVRWNRVPTGFVRIDGSSELWEVAEVLGPRVLSYMLQRRPKVHMTEVYPDLCDAWSCLGPPLQAEIRAKVKRVLKAAQGGPFKGYLKLESDQIVFIANPLDFGTDRRTSAYKSLRTAWRKVIDRYRDELGVPEQLSLSLG
ncbi:MAG: hypothetical protein M3406_13270 [Chloroflexota bacterium]|nr:hypothetical protein [Chloroflexota bacterium]